MDAAANTGMKPREQPVQNALSWQPSAPPQPTPYMVPGQHPAPPQPI